MTTFKQFFKSNYFVFIIFLVIALSFLLRYFRATIGLPYVYFWDEPQTASTALQMMKTGDLNPNFFSYGTFMIYLNLLVDKLHYLYLVTQTSDLTQLDEIKTKVETGWHWTISHPSFYFWNRILTALLGTATVFVTYLIGKHVFNKWIGLISAVFLATLPIHIEHSAVITSDAPVALFVLSVVLFSILFIKTEQKKYFILSLVFVGLAIATKYNAGLALLLPLVSLLWLTYKQKRLCKRNYWILLFTVPTVVFIIAMPYAILDAKDFVKEVLYTMQHYKVLGHKGAESIPGWDHFSFQMQNFYQNIGMVATIFVLIGLVSALFRPLLAFTILLPIVYILYMSGMKVNFHRNFIQVYPFIAILIGAAFYYLHYFLNSFFKNLNSDKYSRSILVTTAILVLFLGTQTVTSYIQYWSDRNSKDTRTQAIEILNSAKDIDNIIIAKELRFHLQDLRNLKYSYSIVPLELIGSLEKKSNTLYVLPERIENEQGKYFLETREKQGILEKVSQDQSSAIYQSVGMDSVTYLDRYSINPALSIFTKIPDIKLTPTVISLDTCTLSSDKIKLTNNNILAFNDGSVTTPSFTLNPGTYHFNINARRFFYRPTYKEFDVGRYNVKIIVEKSHKIGTDIFLKVSVFDDGNGLVTEKILEPSSEFSPFSIPFTLNDQGNIRVKLEYLNKTPGESTSPQMELKGLGISI